MDFRICAVTGATGHLGSCLIRELLKDGWTVKVIIRSHTRAIEGLNLEVVRGDVTDEESLMKAFEDIDCVFHLAGEISLLRKKESSLFRINVEGTRNVIGACVRKGVKRLLYCSSIHAFNIHKNEGIIDENSLPALDDHLHPYDRSKAIAQMFVLQANSPGTLETLVVNPTGIIGPFDFKPSRMGKFFLKLLNKSLIFITEGGFNWVDVRDVARGMINAMLKGKAGSSYILGGHPLSIKELVEIFSEITGKRVRVFTLPSFIGEFFGTMNEKFWSLNDAEPLFTRESVRILQSFPRISWEKARRELNYSVRPIRETLRDTIEWLKGNFL